MQNAKWDITSLMLEYFNFYAQLNTLLQSFCKDYKCVVNARHKLILIKRHSRVSALKCIRETEPCSYTRVGKLQTLRIIRSE